MPPCTGATGPEVPPPPTAETCQRLLQWATDDPDGYFPVGGTMFFCELVTNTTVMICDATTPDLNSTCTAFNQDIEEVAQVIDGWTDGKNTCTHTHTHTHTHL